MIHRRVLNKFTEMTKWLSRQIFFLFTAWLSCFSALAAWYGGGSYDGYGDSSILNALFPWWYVRFKINGVPCDQIKSIESVLSEQIKSINGGRYGVP